MKLRQLVKTSTLGQNCSKQFIMDKALRLTLVVGLASCLLSNAHALEFVFSTVPESRQILSTKDAFIERMSPFDRAARMKTDREINEAEFLAFAASSAMEWDVHEKQRMNSILQKLRPAISHLAAILPDRIFLVKTTGFEEGNAAYTREQAIMLPRGKLVSTERELQRILAHEIFHILSRANRKLSSQLYNSIGFRYCGEVEFPVLLAARKITNPDAPRNDHCIQLEIDGHKSWAVPILFSRSSKYDATRGGEFFQYLQFAFLLVEDPKDKTKTRPIYDAGKPRIVAINQVTGFFEQVGQNTNYIIHPEEILADNFALLLLGEDKGRSPEVILKIREILRASNTAR